MNNSVKRFKFSLKGRILWLYIKYQIISKSLLVIFVLPFLSFITQIIIESSGRTNISSGDYIDFFMSLSGISVIASGTFILILILAIDINTFIIISSLVEENKLKIKIKSIFIAILKSLKVFFSPIGILLVVFVAVILPLINIGVTLGPMKSFAVPNFITSVIFANPLYLTLYTIVIGFLTIISFIYIFTIHFALIDNQKIWQALKSSKLLMKKYWKNFFIDYIWTMIKVTFFCFIFGAILFGFFILSTWIISIWYPDNEVLALLLMFSLIELFAFFPFFSVPIAIFVLTKLFYKYNALENKHIEIKLEQNSIWLNEEDLSRKIKVKTKLEVIIVLVIIFTFNFLLAFVVKENFSEIFKTNINVELITHRGGGDLGAENTVDGIKKAIRQKASWTEIDVQRTKDWKYILNHDVNFKRVTGIEKKPIEMTLDEIKKLKVKNNFEENAPAKPVPTFEEVLNVSKGKIGVFVELKWETADEKMVDDVVAIIKSKNMLEECVILSLNYNIIKYTERKYPEIKTGYLYFFSVGDLKTLEGDYLIMEEREATKWNLDTIHKAGKKAVVWTINTPESIEKFIHSDVDGIITDHIWAVKKAIEKSKKRSHLDIIIDNFMR